MRPAAQFNNIFFLFFLFFLCFFHRYSILFSCLLCFHIECVRKSKRFSPAGPSHFYLHFGLLQYHFLHSKTKFGNSIVLFFRFLIKRIETQIRVEHPEMAKIRMGIVDAFLTYRVLVFTYIIRTHLLFYSWFFRQSI